MNLWIFSAALAAAAIFDAGVRVDSGRPYSENRSLDVLRCQSAGENNRSIGNSTRLRLTLIRAL